MTAYVSRGIRPACGLDVDLLAPRLRAEDLAECMAAFGHGSHAALLAGFEDSVAPITATNENGWPVAMFGVRPRTEPGVGHCWALTSDEATRDRRWFLATSRAWIASIAPEWSALTAEVDCRYFAAIRWLRHLGFGLNTIGPSPVTGAPFVLMLRVERAEGP